MKKVIAEFIGTFALVFIGCGTVVVGGMATGPTAITELAIALAFGLSIVAMAYGIGQISGCHVNPAVSFGVFAAGRMTLEELLSYWEAQVAGCYCGCSCPLPDPVGQSLRLEWRIGSDHLGRVQRSFSLHLRADRHFPFSRLHSRRDTARRTVELAGIAIGLTLAAIHLVGINIYLDRQ
jgi:aquaporin Z